MVQLAQNSLTSTSMLMQQMTMNNLLLNEEAELGLSPKSEDLGKYLNTFVIMVLTCLRYRRRRRWWVSHNDFILRKHRVYFKVLLMGLIVRSVVVIILILLDMINGCIPFNKGEGQPGKVYVLLPIRLTWFSEVTLTILDPCYP